MNHFIKFLFLFFLFNNTASAQSRLIKGGEFEPLYGTGSTVKIQDFLMDVYPITNADFLKLVKQQPQWRKSKIKRIFADENYLSQWTNDTVPGKNIVPNAPVTNVSWFAAKEYCECSGKRLPTVDEWEYVAMAGENSKDARSEKSFTQSILSWYETPNTYKKPVGKSKANYWGIHDMYGLVWEWTQDFGALIVSENSQDTSLYCGAGAATTSDLMNYAAFMRYAFRGSLKGDYAIKNLGFRCVQDLNPVNSLK